jgi:TusA-related sulfurtransferase
METADFRGLACPLPVVRCRDLLRAGARELRILVDNEPAVDNVRRFLHGQGFDVRVSQEGPACWSLEARAGAKAAPAADAAP